MSNDDHLDKETSGSVDVTPTGVSAKTNSRMVSAIDRFGGNLVELLNVPLETITNRKRALGEGQVQLINEVKSIALARLRDDPEFAERAVNGFLASIVTKQANKDAVLEKAIEEIRRLPPTNTEAVAGPERLDDAFLDRFERYAEEATEEEVREKWARVLASEVRRPNTFSRKALRVIDELESDTARLFEKVCVGRLGNVLIKSIVGELSFSDVAKLTTAGLMVDPSFLGQISTARLIKDDNSVALWFWSFDQCAFAIKQEGFVKKSRSKGAPVTFDNDPAIPVFVLTDVGRAISSVLPDHTASIISQIVDTISEAEPECELRQYVPLPNGMRWKAVRKIGPRIVTPTQSQD